MKIDIEKIRHDFPMLSQKMHGKPLVYFDSAATAQKPQAVIDSISSFYANSYGTVHRAVYDLAGVATEKYNLARITVQQFLNAAKPEEIIFTRGTTESINLIATVFGQAFITAGDEILISAMEHHSNLVPWQMLAQKSGAVLKVIPLNSCHELDLQAYDLLLSERTKLVAVTHISNVLGTVNPIKIMIEKAHAKGAVVLVDGAQSAPHSRIDVQDLNADFFVFSGHKLFGPTGIGVLYGKEALLNALPPYQGGGDMIKEVYFDYTTYNTLPLKFEAGTPLIAEVLGLKAAIDYLNNIGQLAIEEWETELYNYALKKMSEIADLQIIGGAADKKGVISFIVEGIHPLDIGTFLDMEGIAVRTGHHCAQPLLRLLNLQSTVRVSFAFYNTKAEIDYFTDSLRAILKLLRQFK